MSDNDFCDPPPLSPEEEADLQHAQELFDNFGQHKYDRVFAFVDMLGFEINTLTVIATESYERFAENLQKEIEDETGIRFGIVETHQFAGVTTTGADGRPVPLGLRPVEGLVGAFEDCRPR